MVTEAALQLQMSPEQLAILTALMPTLEGLFLATVTDGKAGCVTLRYDAALEAEVRAAMAPWLTPPETSARST